MKPDETEERGSNPTGTRPASLVQVVKALWRTVRGHRPAAHRPDFDDAARTHAETATDRALAKSRAQMGR
jgi:hypothetical protein